MSRVLWNLGGGRQASSNQVMALVVCSTKAVGPARGAELRGRLRRRAPRQKWRAVVRHPEAEGVERVADSQVGLDGIGTTAHP